jgi:hypothetical protein
VDLLCAVRDLEAIGSLPPVQAESLRRGEEARLHKKKERQKIQEFSDSDDTFYYIAGYTSDGAAYGVTWEEMGLEPYSSDDED